MNARNLMATVARLFMGPKASQDLSLEDEALIPESTFESSGDFLRALTGSVAVVGDYFFPPEIIGGCCPRVTGGEQDIVWNAAAEAADTERVHVVWQAKGDKVWYLVVRSSDMAAHPGTWCPFASVLPGTKDALPPPALYTFFSDESATMMTVLPDALQIHRGTSSVIRAKAERMSREMGGVRVVEMLPDFIEKLTPAPWYSLSLFEERARRILAALSVFAALVVAGISVVVWFVAAMSSMRANIDYDEIKARSEAKSMELLKSAQDQRASPMREQLARFAEINDGLLALNGYLDVYQIAGNKVLWRAYVPENVTSDRISELGGKTLGTGEGQQGVMIGNSKEYSILDKGRRKGK